MKLTWAEPWRNGAWIRRKMREVSKEMPSARAIAVWSGVLAFVAVVGVRWYLPGSEAELTWGNIA